MGVGDSRSRGLVAVAGDVSGWRRGLRDPDLTGVMILQLAVGVLLWVWLAADIDAPSAVEVPITILAFALL